MDEVRIYYRSLWYTRNKAGSWFAHTTMPKGFTGLVMNLNLIAALEQAWQEQKQLTEKVQDDQSTDRQ